jgi:hypothetical protein
MVYPTDIWRDMRVLKIVVDGDPGGGTAHVLQILCGFSKVYYLCFITQADSYLSKEALSGYHVL